jgi:hypothetical protein
LGRQLIARPDAEGFEERMHMVFHGTQCDSQLRRDFRIAACIEDQAKDVALALAGQGTLVYRCV